MKATRYLIIAAVIVALLAATAWVLRDMLIQRLSTPLLKDYGVTIVDVSLDALATSDASINYLELVHDTGTTIAIEALTLPYAARKGQRKTYRAGKVAVITATREAGEPFEMARLLRQVLGLPAILDGSLIIIDEFSLAPYPTVRDVRWTIADAGQRLAGTIDSVAFAVQTSRRSPDSIDIVVSPAGASSDDTIAALLHDRTTGLTIEGASSIDLAAWQPVLRLAGLLPDEIEIASGQAELDFNVTIPTDTAQSPALSAALLPASPLLLQIGNQVGEPASILVQSAGRAEIAATFPEVSWSLGLATASLAVSVGDWRQIPLSLSGIECATGPSCILDARLVARELGSPLGRVTEFEAAAAAKLSFPETGVRLELRPDASLQLQGFRHESVALAQLRAKLVSDAVVELTDAGWRLTADAVDAEIGTLAASDDFSISMPLFLENLTAADSDDTLSLEAGVYSPRSRTTWRDLTLQTPGFRGKVALDSDAVSADLSTVGLHREGGVRMRHAFDTGSGGISVDAALVSLSDRSLSDRLSPAPDDYDLVAGSLAVDLSLEWRQLESRPTLQGQGVIRATGIAGYYGDYAVAGLATDIDVSYRDGAGFRTQPSTVTAALLEVGVPLRGLAARYTLDLNSLAVAVDSLEVAAFGGRITAEPFSFHTEKAVNTLTLNAESLDLTELLSLGEFQAINISGRIGATLPLAVTGDTVTIEGGVVTGIPPGGVIRYRPEQPPDAADTSSLAFAQRLLGNFEFDTLTSDVSLTEEGDMLMQLRLEGRSPDFDKERPVVLNLGVENNIPQMLRSLRAARAVEDILERRLRR